MEKWRKRAFLGQVTKSQTSSMSHFGGEAAGKLHEVLIE
jgi:hypothetical protein